MHYDLPRRRPAAIFDWDETLHRGITLLPWVKFLRQRLAFPPNRVTLIQELFDQLGSGMLPYEMFADQVVTEYARGLAGTPSADIDRLAGEFVDFDQDCLLPFVLPTLKMLQAHDIVAIVVSGCPQEILNHYCSRLGLNAAHGLLLRRHRDGTYSGETAMNTALERHKEIVMNHLSSTYDILIAVGDTSSDWPLLKRAKMPILLESNPGALSPDLIGVISVTPESEILGTIQNFLQS